LVNYADVFAEIASMISNIVSHYFDKVGKCTCEVQTLTPRDSKQVIGPTEVRATSGAT
jgi:hypothetical protein